MKKTNLLLQFDQKLHSTMITMMTFLDQLRASFLSLILAFHSFKLIYQTRHKRLFIGYFLTVLLAFPLSVLRPDILLVLGPMIYGYWHLSTSYKYSSKLISPLMCLSKIQKVTFYGLISLTVLEIGINVYKKFYPHFTYPNEFISLSLSLIFFLYLFIKNGSWNRLPYFLFFFSIGLAILKLSWDEPLNFISITLFGHNWFAFLAWFKFTRDKKNLHLALISLLSFIGIHCLVLSGLMDSYLILLENSFWQISNNYEVSWILAPWTNDEIIWKRALCLYTFGLSIHYFIWIKAIPENVYKNKTPVSFKASYISLKQAYGSSLTYILIGLSVIGTFIWLFHFEIGSMIYFLISNMHAWVELIMLFFAFTIIGNKTNS